ncbi:MAG: mechanosensitive ion channel family protein, partial [Leptolyngbyaceae cyanobacterium MO_188.B28]|nr:mechanosensitive ion channel family protein [Leptolyngbyaceae cyanobacterium MO_188.B28]
SRVHQTRIRELQRLLLNAAQFMLWTAGALFGLSRFPQTRVLAIHWVSLLKIPLVLGLAILGSHILIRLSHITIDRFSLAISTNPLLPKVATDRVQQRIGTLSQVSKSLSFLGIALTSLIFALVILGVNIAPLLAGAGILGVGISLASQGIIKDTINGFLIVFEDQYGVGDIVQIGDWTGLVETLNLRMTQLRNAEGKLITIPNGEIKVVANLSSQWSRVDLNIPIPYEVDLETMMELIEATALDMQADERWRELILETPQMMGVEDFSDRGLILKLWIKTQPLKQWEVAREYRRRLKLALDQAKIQIPAPQRAIWMHAVEPYNLYPKE